MSFGQLWESLLPIGRDPRTGGYRRFSWTTADGECRDWFRNAATERGLRPEVDRNGNLWAWWGPAAAAREGTAGGSGGSSPRASTGAVAVGSHLDSVPGGGAFDGPLGVVSAFAAIDLLRERGVVPVRPVAVAVFTEEEGARFGVACLGSRLLVGAIGPERARELRDADGVTLAAAMAAAGCDTGRLGPDGELLSGLAAYVELHIEQGSQLAGLGAAVGLAEGIWPHGRWRLEFTGQADHAGTAALAGRHDPMLPFAATVLAARRAAETRGGLATIGKVSAVPGAVNAVSAQVTAWLDARAPDGASLAQLVDEVLAAAQAAAAGQQVGFAASQESFTAGAGFDPVLRDRLAASLAAAGITAPVIATGAGHDAGVLAARLPTAMLFVRNPTGVSHAPAEHADEDDCLAGVAALAAVLAELACTSGRQ